MQPWCWWRFRPGRQGRARRPGWEVPVTVAMRLTGHDSPAWMGRRGSVVGRRGCSWAASGVRKKDRGDVLLLMKRF